MQSNAMTEAALDVCIDRLLDGADWEAVLPVEPNRRAEIVSLMPIARSLRALAGHGESLGRPAKERLWRRISHSRRGVIQRIAFYRLPYLPALWIRPEAC